MDYNGGKIWFARKIREHWIWKSPQYYYWWSDLVFGANYKDTKSVARGHFFILKRGQLEASSAFLSKRWNASRPTVVTFLKLLQQDGMIKHETLYGSKSIITICNYDSYQATLDTSFDTSLDTSLDSPLDTSLDTSLDTKRINKEQNNNISRASRLSRELSSDNSSSSADAEDGGILLSPQENAEVYSKNKREKIDCKKFVEFWNKTVEGTRVPQLRGFADWRKNTLAARMSTYGKKAVFEVVEKIPKSDVLSGRSSEWKADFKWIFGPKNFPNVLDGNYDENYYNGNYGNRQKSEDRRRGYDAPPHSAEEYEKDF